MKEKQTVLLTDEQISALLRGLDDSLEVPLDVSVAWKKAVKQEARRQRWFGHMRWTAEIAAAVVLILGTAFLWQNLNANAFTVDSQAANSALYSDITNDYVFYKAQTPQEETGALLFSDGADNLMDGLVAGTAMGLLDTGSAMDDALDAGAAIERGFVAAQGSVKEEVEKEVEETAYDEFMHIASINISEPDISAAQIALDTIVKNIAGCYYEETVWGENFSSGKIRVPNARLDELLGSIKSHFHCTVKHEIHNVGQDYHDLAAKIDAAYNTIDELLRLRSLSTNTDEIAQINTRLQLLYDEIDEYEHCVERSRFDLEYATVYYNIDARASVQYAGSISEKTGGDRSFFKYMLTVSAFLLPTAALSVCITLHAIKHKSKRQEY